MARKRTQRVDEVVAVNQLPQPVGAHLGERILDLYGSAQLLHVFGRIGPLDAVKAAFRCAGNQVVKISHADLRSLNF